MSDIGTRERHTSSGHLRVRCHLCDWVSGTFPTEASADLAMGAHAEAMHGVTVGAIRDAGQPGS